MEFQKLASKEKRKSKKKEQCLVGEKKLQKRGRKSDLEKTPNRTSE